MRIYSSTDGGRSWTTVRAHPPPAKPLASCSSDPGVAIDAKGRQYYSFVRATPCSDGARQYVYVVVRTGPEATWSKPIRVAALGRARLDDKPAIAVDNSPRSPHQGRVYLAWTRIARNVAFSIVLSHSDNGGRTWSKPVKVRNGTRADVRDRGHGTDGCCLRRVGRRRRVRDLDGALDGRRRALPRPPQGGVLRRGHDPALRLGNRHPRAAAYLRQLESHRLGGHLSWPLLGPRVRELCANGVSRPPGGAHRGVRPEAPSDRAGSRYARGETAWRRASAARGADQFWPQSAVDASNGTVWMCFYDTLGDPARKRAFYSCTISRNGGRTWRPPIRAATVPSDETVPGSLGHYGYHQGVAASGGIAHPIWTDTRELADFSEEIYTTSLREADFSTVVAVSRSAGSASRSRRRSRRTSPSARRRAC